MMRSMFAGVSGLKNHQTRMDVIGNNIANVNTVGFKASRVNFQDILSQTLHGASSGQGVRGGTNPMQVGLGMGLASIDTLFTDGSFQPTGKQTDLSIQGSGFFVLSDGVNQVYTRAGAFDFDNQGNFLVPGTGYKVMGWKADATGVIDTNAPVENLVVPVGTAMPAKVSSSVTYANNLSASATAGVTSQVPASIDVYDSQGNAYNLGGTFHKTAANTWEFTPNPTIVDAKSNTIANVVTSPAAGVPFTINFNADGSFNTSSAGTITINPAVGPYAGAGTFSITPHFDTMTQYGGESTAQAVDRDGYAQGTLESNTIDTDGIITGRFSNGQSQALGRVALATFNNPTGLSKVGDNLYSQSNNSGLAQVGPANSGGRGKFNPGSLEMANVDLAQEFSNMIITQRGFQANSKIISVSDEMLQELANLKR
ncbi:MAG: flagellar hook protein FlgE [Negativicutes bacterium]|nr:flagellar hook protein FlgE [Negativicutes bacterium]